MATNQAIRKAARIAGVPLWRIADRYGISATWFSTRLRKELPKAEQEKILAIIEELSQEMEAEQT